MNVDVVVVVVVMMFLFFSDVVSLIKFPRLMILCDLMWGGDWI